MNEASGKIRVSPVSHTHAHRLPCACQPAPSVWCVCVPAAVFLPVMLDQSSAGPGSNFI